jgi:integrase
LIDDNPARNVRKFKSNSEGFHSWSEGDVTDFEAVHKPGSRAHLALSLLLYTGQRRSDIVRMGWQHVNGNLLSVVQDKTGEFLKIPFHPKLAAVLTVMPRTNLIFLLTEAGKPFTVAGFGNWFRDAAMKLACHIVRLMVCVRLALLGWPTPDARQSR